MRADHRSPLHMSGSSHAPGSVVWFLSFGDLLTLLLCFFLVLTPWDQLAKPKANEGSQEVTPKQVAGRASGTRLAHLPPRGEPELVAEVPVYAGLISSQDGVAEARLLAALEDVMQRHTGSGSLTMKVVLCPGAADQRGGFLSKVLPIAAAPGFSRAALEVEAAVACEKGEAAEGQEGVPVGSVKVSRM